MSEQTPEPAGQPAEPLEESGEEAQPQPAEPSPDELEGEEGEGAEQPAEPPAEPPPAEGMSEKQIEAAFGKLDKEAERHAGRVRAIMGADAEMLQACPLCEPLIPGYVLPSPALLERSGAVLAFLGITPPRELEDDPRSSVCSVCNGWGVVKTPSHVEAFMEMACEDCSGRGIVGERFTGAAIAPVLAPTPAVDNGAAVTGPTAPEDPAAQELRDKGFIVIAPAGTT